MLHRLEEFIKSVLADDCIFLWGEGGWNLELCGPCNLWSSAIDSIEFNMHSSGLVLNFGVLQLSVLFLLFVGMSNVMKVMLL